jgi:hypothetical protein
LPQYLAADIDFLQILARLVSGSTRIFFEIRKVLSESCDSATEEVENGKDIFNLLSFWRQVTGVEKHEFAILLLSDPVDKVKLNPCESIFVADQNLSDVS